MSLEWSELFLPIDRVTARDLLAEWQWVVGDRDLRAIGLTLFGDWVLEDRDNGSILTVVSLADGGYLGAAINTGARRSRFDFFAESFHWVVCRIEPGFAPAQADDQRASLQRQLGRRPVEHTTGRE